MQGVLIRFELKGESSALGFDAVAEKLIAAVRASEPDTLIFLVHGVENAPLSRVVYEIYASSDAQKKHESAAYFKDALAELEHHVESARVEVLGPPRGKLAT